MNIRLLSSEGRGGEAEGAPPDAHACAHLRPSPAALLAVRGPVTPLPSGTARSLEPIPETGFRRTQDSEQKQEAGIRSRGFSLGVDPKSLLDPDDVRPRARLSTWWQDLLLSRQMVFDVRLPDKAA